MHYNLKLKIPKSEQRSVKEIQEHYELERKLAEKLLKASKHERKYLPNELYDELFSKIPHHSQLTRKTSKETIAWIVAQRMQLLKQFLSPETTFLEIGSGDCNLSIEVFKQVRKVYAVDVTREFSKKLVFPSNLEFILSDGCSVPVPKNTVDIAYSHQLMEHLHPDDAIEQLHNIYETLAPNGVYICITPNRLSGPHDISKYFDEVATGFHLKEYTVSELYELFRAVGFSRISWVKSNKNRYLEIPLNVTTLFVVKTIEKCLDSLSYSSRKKIAGLPMLFRGMTIVGKK